MSLENIIEEKIQKAMLNGEFDNLEGAGKPLNLDDYGKIFGLAIHCLDRISLFRLRLICLGRLVN